MHLNIGFWKLQLTQLQSEDWSLCSQNDTSHEKEGGISRLEGAPKFAEVQTFFIFLKS